MEGDKIETPIRRPSNPLAEQYDPAFKAGHTLVEFGLQCLI